MGAVRITLRTPVAVTRVDDIAATAAEVEALAGRLLWEGDLAEELPDAMHAKGIAAGPLRLESGTHGALLACLDFTFAAAPSATTIARLLDEVHGQYLDGIGESGFDVDVGGQVLHVELVLADAPSRSFAVESAAIAAPTRSRTSPLLKAAGNGDADKVRRLLAKGEPANATGKYAVTPLILAVQGGHGEVVAILLAAGADPNQGSERGTAPLLHAAMANAPVAIAEQLVAAGADPRARNGDGFTPVAMAANRGADDLLAFLLDVGVDVDVQDGSGLTPLMLAQARADVRLLEQLLAHGADPMLRNHQGHDAAEAATWQADGFARMGDFYEERVAGERRKAEFLRRAVADAAGRGDRG